MSGSSLSFWVIVPAAGSSRRMVDAALPKQYLQLAGRSVIEWSLAPFLARPECAGIVVVLAAQDAYWKTLATSNHSLIETVTGGAQRADSVQSGLHALQGRAGPDDWVLVHDAARPCLRATELTALLSQLRGDTVGGLLAAPVVETLKRSDGTDRVAQTVDRNGLWRALTPQMFRYGTLTRALATAADRNISVTDESQAIELLGLRPRLVPGSVDNIKVTVPEDLARAERILAHLHQLDQPMEERTP
ncbi:MAG TPA: 2-C-methyl-D-erythritol 4-phosphate cytidylyltransferase [Steroidobacteraceae bacterium]|jgi:2-C-methyl-D-erythritol 4-phosphate cytidylyltransferase